MRRRENAFRAIVVAVRNGMVSAGVEASPGVDERSHRCSTRANAATPSVSSRCRTGGTRAIHCDLQESQTDRVVRTAWRITQAVDLDRHAYDGLMEAAARFVPIWPIGFSMRYRSG
jgi:hypothetical protein